MFRSRVDDWAKDVYAVFREFRLYSCSIFLQYFSTITVDNVIVMAIASILIPATRNVNKQHERNTGAIHFARMYA